MIRLIAWSVGTSFLFSIVEMAVFVHVSYLSIMPDLVLLVVLFTSIHNGVVAGIWTGFIAGIIFDFLSISPFGLHSFVFTTIGFMVGKVQGRYHIDRVFAPAVLAGFAMIFKVGLVLVLRGVFGPNIQVYSVFSRQLWIEMTLNIVFVPFVFGLLNMFPTTFLYKMFSS